MIQKIEEIGSLALRDVAQATSINDLEHIRVTILGKKGRLSDVLRELGSISALERPKIGAVANEWKRKLEDALTGRKKTLENIELSSRLVTEAIDVTLPGRKAETGTLHVVTQTTRKIIEVFSRLGFEVVSGPEVETSALNFDAINIAKDHPARDMQDTFSMGPGVVLRTHTSPVQMRTMKAAGGFPLRVLCPGAVYRCDNDVTHSPMFHQIEGLWIDHGTKMSDLIGTLEFFAREIFGPSAKIRLRPSYFPFVEPGAEVDVSCFQCLKSPSAQCPICKGTGWMEILGAGMVHRRLFEEAGPGFAGATGFAFGVGIERVAMLLHAIPNIRLLYQNDVRFLGQFS